MPPIAQTNRSDCQASNNAPEFKFEEPWHWQPLCACLLWSCWFFYMQMWGGIIPPQLVYLKNKFTDLQVKNSISAPNCNKNKLQQINNYTDHQIIISSHQHFILFIIHILLRQIIQNEGYIDQPWSCIRHRHDHIQPGVKPARGSTQRPQRLHSVTVIITLCNFQSQSQILKLLKHVPCQLPTSFTLQTQIRTNRWQTSNWTSPAGLTKACDEHSNKALAKFEIENPIQ